MPPTRRGGIFLVAHWFLWIAGIYAIDWPLAGGWAWKSLWSLAIVALAAIFGRRRIQAFLRKRSKARQSARSSPQELR